MNYRLRSRCASVLAFGLPLAVYVASLRPGVDFWDTGELQTVPYILGIPHPSGFPAYVLIGWVWSHVVPFGDPAYRMNLLSAVGMASAAFALSGALVELAVEPVFACGAAVVFAVTRVPWDHATQADVHPLALAAIGLSFWAALRWGRSGSRRALYACALAAALALAIHSGTVLILPAIVFAVYARRPSLRRAGTCLVAGALVVTAAYAYLPLRSAVVYAQRRDPTLALGLPAGRPFWDTDHPASWAGFWREVGGGDFGAGMALRRVITTNVFAALPERYGRAAVGDLAGGVLVIALIGLITVIRRAPFAGVGIFSGALVPILFVLTYRAESDPDRYFLPSYWAIGFFLGAGADMLARGGLATAPRALVLAVGAMFVFVAATNVYVNRGAFDGRASDAQAFITRVVRETPARGIIVAPWMYATPLAYAAYVQKRLGDRILVTGWPEDYIAYYPAWIADRPITFVTDDPVLAVSGIRMRVHGPLTPAPHFFSAQGASP